MFSLLRLALWLVGKVLLSLRYRVRVHGREALRGLKGPVLILPNHPAFIDPPLVLAALGPTLRPRPLVYEGNFRNPVLYPLVKALDAVRVPDLDQTSAHARDRARQAVDEVIAGLRRGECHILWASGRLWRNGAEAVGGARALAEMLSAVPETTLVLVRTRGLWGSMFSFAPTGRLPDLGGRLLAGAGWLLANLLLFMPRRRVDVTVERVDPDRLPGRQREVLNPWLEAWFNAPGPEKPTFVPYHFLFGPRTFSFPPLREGVATEGGRVSRETKAAVADLIAARLGRPLGEGEQQAETSLARLGLDSLDVLELTLALEQRFGFASDLVPVTLGQAWALAEGVVQRALPRPPAPAWFRPPADEGPARIPGPSIPEAFVARALAHPGDVAAADDVSGVLTYQRLLVGALTLSRRFAALPGDNVGLMLPASVACDVAFLALHLAGKLPVMLNWTTGPGHLAHAGRTTGLSHVVTSRRFIDRTGVVVEGVRYLYLEDLRRGVGRVELARTMLGLRLFPGRVRRRVPATPPDRVAVVLFTSGSERAPKAVPLTHDNILSNQRNGLPVLGLTRRDSWLGFLPPFHGFGLSVTTLLPLLTGMRVVHHPDPTDAAGLAAKTAGYRPTVLVGTPTFLGHVLDRARPGDLDSLRLIIVGAEKCPRSVFERCARLAPRAEVLEGYGVTECSPVVSVNPPGSTRPGTLGQPLPGVDVCVVDLETDEVLPPGRMGMLLVSGPSVFPGYLGDGGPSPFRERDGKRWYVTGDLASLDADGFLHFGGRLKRFLKAGGEMISLPALEEPFARLHPPTEDGPRVAVEGVETEGLRRIVLFTTEPTTLAEANALLHQEGYRGVMRLDEVRPVRAIPVLGTGKTDYKALRALLESSLGVAGSVPAAGG
jgi:long-chain-fatty-acid--[acyl-carrier-protein] ligase